MTKKSLNLKGKNPNFTIRRRSKRVFSRHPDIERIPIGYNNSSKQDEFSGKKGIKNKKFENKFPKETPARGKKSLSVGPSGKASTNGSGFGKIVIISKKRNPSSQRFSLFSSSPEKSKKASFQLQYQKRNQSGKKKSLFFPKMKRAEINRSPRRHTSKPYGHGGKYRKLSLSKYDKFETQPRYTRKHRGSEDRERHILAGYWTGADSNRNKSTVFQSEISEVSGVENSPLNKRVSLMTIERYCQKQDEKYFFGKEEDCCAGGKNGLFEAASVKVIRGRSMKRRKCFVPDLRRVARDLWKVDDTLR